MSETGRVQSADALPKSFCGGRKPLWLSMKRARGALSDQGAVVDGLVDDGRDLDHDEDGEAIGLGEEPDMHLMSGGQNTCNGFEVPKDQVLNTLAVDETRKAASPGNVVVRAHTCTNRARHAGQGICLSCITSRNTYRRYIRTIAHVARDKFDTNLEDLMAMSKFQLLHKLAARMTIIEKSVKEEKRKMEQVQKSTFPPIAALVRYLENEGLLPETCFFYKFLYVTLHYWRRILEKGARGWVWDRCKFGAEVLTFFIGLRKLEGGRRACRYLISENEKTIKPRASGPTFDPHDVRLPIPPLPTLEARILQEKKESHREILGETVEDGTTTNTRAEVSGTHETSQNPDSHKLTRFAKLYHRAAGI
ncbi:Hypothetical Protein FCC1311_053932 [Hondaea fermentalgiana]|uniref:Uncharacterized protein n=1 Tax=Hondaea fermentalgiana TaxID=2315210 RepID=A0A2R5GLL4_9STRA|nr:Hypothetical Protein FCC1311_053932 [Hondaea fermentalgiana]|eukprot:GBG29171.1 Hypothetical Protein FCC1311_053932 [Hondaea fermentalgiana]